ncbi:MAG: UDP-N-acetylmuramate dehydrogenase [Parvularculaceae bacterium]
MTSEGLADRLPKPRGKLRAGARLADLTWFRVGGPADVLFEPEDEDDLATFLAATPEDIPVTVIGAGANLIVRDGGVRGVVVRLGKAFADIAREGDARLVVGAGAKNAALAKAARDAGLTGLEFLIGVPGTVGGAVAMNAGAYGTEVADILIQATGLDRKGRPARFSRDEMGYGYRRCAAVEKGVIFTRAVFAGRYGAKNEIAERMKEITAAREETQPIKERTGGSTFKNPDRDQAGGKRAWELIDAAGGRGRKLGGAEVSERHCNFLINTGSATAADLEALGESLRTDVKRETGVELEWEIKRIGEAG